MGNQNQNGEGISFLDALTIFSVILQTLGYQQDQKQASNDVLLKELHRQNGEYLETILKNQKEIMNELAEINSAFANRG